MTAATMTGADIDMVRFLTEASFTARETPWRFHELIIPEVEVQTREYEHETERLRRFIRGQQIAEGRAA